jgi:intein-encoded DNA endonuclease-like protein
MNILHNFNEQPKSNLKTIHEIYTFWKTRWATPRINNLQKENKLKHNLEIYNLDFFKNKKIINFKLPFLNIYSPTSQNSQITPQNSQITPQNSQITPQNSQITPQNSQITPQNSQITQQITSQNSQITQQITSQNSQITQQITSQNSQITQQITPQKEKNIRNKFKLLSYENLLEIIELKNTDYSTEYISKLIKEKFNISINRNIIKSLYKGLLNNILNDLNLSKNEVNTIIHKNNEIILKERSGYKRKSDSNKKASQTMLIKKLNLNENIINKILELRKSNFTFEKISREINNLYPEYNLNINSLSKIINSFNS